MKFTPEVQAALQTLKDNAESDFERHRIAVLEKDLTAPPKVEVIDDTHQKFNGVIYKKGTGGHFEKGISIHRAIWMYYNGEIPTGNYEIHHIDQNKANNDISNMQLLTKSEHQKLHNKIAREQKFRICPICGENFLYKNGHISQIYCSHACRGKALRKIPVEKICPVCNKKFIAHQQRPNQVCCSDSCSAKLRIDKKPEIEKSCVVCGKKFVTKIPERIYCSKSCSLRAWRKKPFTSPAATTSPLNHSAD